MEMCAVGLPSAPAGPARPSGRDPGRTVSGSRWHAVEWEGGSVERAGVAGPRVSSGLSEETLAPVCGCRGGMRRKRVLDLWGQVELSWAPSRIDRGTKKAGLCVLLQAASGPKGQVVFTLLRPQGPPGSGCCAPASARLLLVLVRTSWKVVDQIGDSTRLLSLGLLEHGLPRSWGWDGAQAVHADGDVPSGDSAGMCKSGPQLVTVGANPVLASLGGEHCGLPSRTLGGKTRQN